MSFPTLDLPQALGLLTNPEDVTVYPNPTSNAEQSSYEDITASRYDLSLKEVAASNGVYLGGYCRWTVWAKDLSILADGQIDDVMMPRGYIVDADDVRHTILNVTTDDITGYTTVETVNLKLAAGLTDTVNV